MNQSRVSAQCSPGVVHKFVWQLRDAGLYLSYSSPGILGVLQMAPKVSLFQASRMDDSEGWYNCLAVMFLLRRKKTYVQERKCGACLSAGTIPVVQLTVA